MGAVTFDAGAFKVRYPEFSGVANALLDAYFVDAQLYLSNTDCPVADEARRLSLFWMLVAHTGMINGCLNKNGKPNGMVGRVSSASEGSVSASSEYAVAGSGIWFSQTPYGAAFWQATSNLRSFVYRARPTRY
jgi:hypothetical protein